jgi:hypothetical protein
VPGARGDAAGIVFDFEVGSTAAAVQIGSACQHVTAESGEEQTAEGKSLTDVTRFRISITLQILALLGCLLLATRTVAQTRPDDGSDSRIAVLENRTDAIDHHLQNTDSIEDRMEGQIQAQSEILSRMEGQNQVEQWIAWGIISLLSGSSLLAQFRSRNKDRAHERSHS